MAEEMIGAGIVVMVDEMVDATVDEMVDATVGEMGVGIVGRRCRSLIRS
jgi:hypothetical protein